VRDSKVVNSKNRSVLIEMGKLARGTRVTFWGVAQWKGWYSLRRTELGAKETILKL